MLKSQETIIRKQETLLDYSYHQNYYKLIGIHLLRQKNTKISQISFTRKLEEDNDATMFLSLKSSKKNFSLDSLNVLE